jgi:hypothetical protein
MLDVFGAIYHNNGDPVMSQNNADGLLPVRLQPTAKDISSLNLNSYTEDGWYKGSTVTNAPNAGWWFFTIIRHATTYVVQTAEALGPGNNGTLVYKRWNEGGVWSGWTRYYSTDVEIRGLSTNFAISSNAGTNTAMSNQTAWGDLLPVALETALTSTFTKVAAATKLIVTLFLPVANNSGALQKFYAGVNIDGTDYELGAQQFAAAPDYKTVSGVQSISGLAAGSHTIKPRFKASAASSVAVVTGDRVSYSVVETG